MARLIEGPSADVVAARRRRALPRLADRYHHWFVVFKTAQLRRDPSDYATTKGVLVVVAASQQDGTEDTLAIHTDIAESVDVHSDGRDGEALIKTGALQRAIFNSANFSSIATDAKGV